VTVLIDCAHARGAHFVQHVVATVIGEQLDFEGWTLSRLHEFVLQIVLALPDHLERIAEASRVELAYLVEVAFDEKEPEKNVETALARHACMTLPIVKGRQ